MLNQILFFFSAVGVFNALLIAIYFLIGKSSTSKYYFVFGLFLLSLSIRVGVSCFYFFNKEFAPFLIQLGLVSNVLSGFFLFMIIDTSHLHYKKEDKIHFVILLFLILISGISYPFSKHFEVWDLKIRFIYHCILFIYLVMSWKRLLVLNKKNKLYNLNQLLLISFTLICSGFVVSLFTNYILGPILFSFIFYLAIVYYYKLRVNKKKYVGKKISPEIAKRLSDKLNSYIISSEVYKKHDLRINDLSNSLKISRHQITQLLNDNLGLSFSTYINTFRVEEAKRLLLSNSKLTIEAIGNEAGFKSKSTFFTVFKKMVNQTPKSYIENN